MIKFRPKKDSYEEEMKDLFYYDTLGDLADDQAAKYAKELNTNLRRASIKFRPDKTDDNDEWKNTFKVMLECRKLDKPMHIGYCAALASNEY